MSDIFCSQGHLIGVLDHGFPSCSRCGGAPIKDIEEIKKPEIIQEETEELKEENPSVGGEDIKTDGINNAETSEPLKETPVVSEETSDVSGDIADTPAA